MSDLTTRFHTGTPQNLEARFAHRATGMVASEIRSLFAVASRPEIVSLAGGMPNLSAFPMEMMASVIEKLILENGQEALQYGSGQGHPKLREQVADFKAAEGFDSGYLQSEVEVRQEVFGKQAAQGDSGVVHVHLLELEVWSEAADP